jgi:hypothetical protein
MAKVYVIEVSPHAETPNVEVYEFISQTEHSIKVKCRGNTKIIRNAVGRSFYHDLDKVKKYCRDYIDNRISMHKRRIRELEEINELPLREIPPEIPVYKGPIKL